MNLRMTRIVGIFSFTIAALVLIQCRCYLLVQSQSTLSCKVWVAVKDRVRGSTPDST